MAFAQGTRGLVEDTVALGVYSEILLGLALPASIAGMLQNPRAFGQMTLGGAFEYIDLGDARIKSNTLRGDYQDNRIFAFGINMSYEF